MRPSPAHLCLALATLGAAETAPLDPLTHGTVDVALRARSEIVDQDGIERRAYANTLRLALGYTTRPWHGLSAAARFEGVFDPGGSAYSHPIEPDGSRPTVLDHTTTSELQHALLRYSIEAPMHIDARLGRQELAYDNQRWIGPVGWRQDQQSFDAARVDVGGSLGDLGTGTASVAWISRINRIFPQEDPRGTADCESLVANLAWKPATGLQATAYLYDLDFTGGAIPDTLSSRTIGLRLGGTVHPSDDWSLAGTAEYARQHDAGANPLRIDQDYLLAEVDAGWRGLHLIIGQERLGGDSSTAGDVINTPLATLHAHDGWADVFAASTPAGGLVDLYVKLISAIPGIRGLSAQAIWHDFSAEDADAPVDHYGDELDLLVECSVAAIDPRLMVGAKYARYEADELGVDTTKLWLYTQFAF